MGPPSSGALTVGQMLGILVALRPAGDGPGPRGHPPLRRGRQARLRRPRPLHGRQRLRRHARRPARPRLPRVARRADRPRRADGQAPSPGEPPWDEGRAPGARRRPPEPRHLAFRHRRRLRRHGLARPPRSRPASAAAWSTDGFLLNNELTDFAFAPEADGKPVANRVEAGKRPRSSMAPTIVLRGRRADAADRLARRRQHHPLRRPGAGRHPRLRPGPAGRRRRAARAQPQRQDPGRGRPRRRGDRRRPHRARPDRRGRRPELRPPRHPDRRRHPHRRRRHAGARGWCSATDAAPQRPATR